MITRRSLLLSVTLGYAVVARAGQGQPQRPRPHIGVLQSGTPAAVSHMVEALRQGLRDHGWVEGQNITLEYRFGHAQVERFPELVADLARLKVDIIVTGGLLATSAAAKMVPTIPIVFWAVPTPVDLGLVASLARPGGNLTGVSVDVTPATHAKILQLIKDIVPKTTRVAVLRHASVQDEHWNALVVPARSLGLTLHAVEVHGVQDFDEAFATILRARPDALFVTPTPVFFTNRRRVLDFLASHPLPAASGFKEFADGGGLMSYGPSLTDQARRAAYFVDKILRGARPADLPVEQPTKFELVINTRTAKALGVSIPAAVLLQADELIQ